MRDSGFDYFDDVPSKLTHAYGIDCIAYWGVTKGVGYRLYNPSGNVTRGQMASFIARTIELTRGELPVAPAGSTSFSDVAGNVHADAIVRATAAGFTGGVTSERYDPNAAVTRAQMGTFLARLIAYTVEQGHSDDRPEQQVWASPRLPAPKPAPTPTPTPPPDTSPEPSPTPSFQAPRVTISSQHCVWDPRTGAGEYLWTFDLTGGSVFTVHENENPWMHAWNPLTRKAFYARTFTMLSNHAITGARVLPSGSIYVRDSSGRQHSLQRPQTAGLSPYFDCG